VIKIAAATRHWFRRRDWYNKRPVERSIVCMAVAELWFDINLCQFRVKYHEQSDMTREQWIPEHCTKAWLNHFSRDQSTLQPDSYYITEMRTDWGDFLKKLVDNS
jgi:hypothetical protein